MTHSARHTRTADDLLPLLLSLLQVGDLLVDDVFDEHKGVSAVDHQGGLPVAL